MSALRAQVKNGRLVLDTPTTLPEGTVIDLVADDEGDDPTDDERRALHDALSASWKSAAGGRLRPASAILGEVRQRTWRGGREFGGILGSARHARDGQEVERPRRYHGPRA